jgi:hypothetical protein
MKVTNAKRLYLDGNFTKVKDLGDGTFEGIVATSDLDRQGEKIQVSGLDTHAFITTNPIVLFGHDYEHSENIIGKAISLTKTKTGELLSRFKLFTDFNPQASFVSKVIKEGVCALSIGFVPEEIDGDTYTKSEMAEFSVVPVPANALAAITTRGLNLTQKEAKYIHVVFKGAISSDLPVADEGTAWDKGKAISSVKEWASDSDGNIDFSKYRKAFFWVDPENADKQGGYKLPFAQVMDGSLKAVWNGVSAAMGAVNGARGGVNIPESDKSAVYAQIKKYYKKFDKDVPDMKAITDEIVDKGAVADEIAEEQELDEKYQNLDGVMDIWWAFVDVYCSPDTPAENFNDLLKETAGLLGQVADGSYTPPDDDDTPEDDETVYSSQSLKKGVTTERRKELLVAITKDDSMEPDPLQPQPEQPAPAGGNNPQNPPTPSPSNTVVTGNNNDANVQPGKALVGKDDDNNNENLWLNVLQAISQVDKIVDQLQVDMSQALGVPNPDEDHQDDEQSGNRNGAGDMGMGDGGDMGEHAMSTGGNDNPQASNTVRSLDDLKKLDISKLSDDNLKQLAATFTKIAVALESKVNSLDTTNADTHAEVRKRRVVLAQAKKTAQAGDRVVELVLNELKALH